MGFEVKVLAKSKSPDGVMLTTMAVTYPRIIHAEMLRHRVFSRCAASSRAIPVQRFIEQVVNDPYVPEHWGANKSGMQAGEELPAEVAASSVKEWLKARDAAVEQAQRLLDLGVHKQTTNRLLEPFQWMTEVVTGTEWGNFFRLRVHPDAHPDIRRTAGAMLVALEGTRATRVEYDEWHLPLISQEDREAFSDRDPAALPLKDLPLASAGRVARVSYLRHDDVSDITKDIDRANKMLEHAHMSPFEHVARPMSRMELDEYVRWETYGTDGRVYWLGMLWDTPPMVGHRLETGVHIASVTGVKKAFLGNYNGWVQYRKEIPREYDMLAPTNQHLGGTSG